MATTLKGRAGSSLRVQFAYRDTDGELIDTSENTARIQFRSASANSRVLIETTEYTGSLPAPENTILTRLEPGRWELFLGKTTVSSFVPTVRWELELEATDNPEDSIALAVGVLLIEPQAVNSIE